MKFFNLLDIILQRHAHIYQRQGNQGEQRGTKISLRTAKPGTVPTFKYSNVELGGKHCTDLCLIRQKRERTLLQKKKRGIHIATLPFKTPNKAVSKLTNINRRCAC